MNDKIREALKHLNPAHYALMQPSMRTAIQCDSVQNLTPSGMDSLKENVSVTDFGAVGDGVADDTMAIQRAIDFAKSGYEVLVPAGSYRVTSTLALR